VPIATTEQYAAMLAGAAAGGHALAGVNVSSSEALNAALYGFTEAQADGILQVSTGGGRVPIGDRLERHRRGCGGVGVVRAGARRALPVLVALHTDYCPPDSGVGQNKAHDPRSWGSEGGAAMATRVAQGELLGPAGRSVLR
jgi:fructose-bisphosphate aldolase class II